MDVKELKTEAALGDRNVCSNKFPQGGTALQCNKNKTYQDIGSNSSSKVDVPTSRPCAVIGPDRIVPPSVASSNPIKRVSYETWPYVDPSYQRPPDYPHQLLDHHQSLQRNISPRQTYQENMPRISVQPTCNTSKLHEVPNYPTDRNDPLSKNMKLNISLDSKSCDVPYIVNPVMHEQKTVRNPEVCASNINNADLALNAPHSWPYTSGNMRPAKQYGAQEMFQYPEYPGYVGPRPVPVQPHRSMQDVPGQVYCDQFFPHQDPNNRYKPYPNIKERYSQPRYEYIANFNNSYPTPPTFQPHKSIPPHPYPSYPHVPLKYIDNRMPDPLMEGYQRSNQTINYNPAFHNQVMHSMYGTVPRNCVQNKMYPYPSDPTKINHQKSSFDNNNKIYIDYENARNKTYPSSENMYLNDISRTHHLKNQGLMPNYSPNFHSMGPHPYFRRENPVMRNYDLMAQYRNADPSLHVNSVTSKFPSQFSPSTIAISPSDSSTSNETTLTHGTLQEDCGYVSQSSTNSVRSIDYNRLPYATDAYKRYESRYGPLRTSELSSRHNSHANTTKCKKDIDVRQFLQMWSEGDEENTDNNKAVSAEISSNQREVTSNQEQLYVLGLVNVPSNELGKYEHIQKVSKLPENIKGFSSIELLNQFEEAIESSNINNFVDRNPIEFQVSKNNVSRPLNMQPNRPVSPLDVEAKISQSVIHKEVGCNFEIKPCSPKMLNVEVATPVQTIINERMIEKISNPHGAKSSSFAVIEKTESNIMKNEKQSLVEDKIQNSSCKLSPCASSEYESGNMAQNNYSLQDFESSSGVCLASLPRLDNDIELSFPEVNQQFINANKVESVIAVSPSNAKSLPGDLSDNIPELGSNTPTSGTQNEREFSKLSKYRKVKSNGSENKEISLPSISPVIRTDSVIIKNPENTKYQDENNRQLSTSTETSSLKITLHSNQSENLEPSNDDLIDMALDFSVNKMDNDQIDINMKNRSEPTKSCTERIVSTHRKTLDETICQKDFNMTNSEHKTFITSNENNPLVENQCTNTNLQNEDECKTNINNADNKSIIENIQASVGLDSFKNQKNLIENEEEEISQVNMEDTTQMIFNDLDISHFDKDSIIQKTYEQMDEIFSENKKESTGTSFIDKQTRSLACVEYEIPRLEIENTFVKRSNNSDLTSEVIISNILDNVGNGLKTKTVSYFSKELFSPQIQKLFIRKTGIDSNFRLKTSNVSNNIILDADNNDLSCTNDDQDAETSCDIRGQINFEKFNMDDSSHSSAIDVRDEVYNSSNKENSELTFETQKENIIENVTCNRIKNHNITENFDGTVLNISLCKRSENENDNICNIVRSEHNKIDSITSDAKENHREIQNDGTKIVTENIKNDLHGTFKDIVLDNNDDFLNSLDDEPATGISCIVPNITPDFCGEIQDGENNFHCKVTSDNQDEVLDRGNELHCNDSSTTSVTQKVIQNRGNEDCNDLNITLVTQKVIQDRCNEDYNDLNITSVTHEVTQDSGYKEKCTDTNLTAVTQDTILDKSKEDFSVPNITSVTHDDIQDSGNGDNSDVPNITSTHDNIQENYNIPSITPFTNEQIQSNYNEAHFRDLNIVTSITHDEIQDTYIDKHILNITSVSLGDSQDGDNEVHSSATNITSVTQEEIQNGDDIETNNDAITASVALDEIQDKNVGEHSIVSKRPSKIQEESQDKGNEKTNNPNMTSVTCNEVKGSSSEKIQEKYHLKKTLDTYNVNNISGNEGNVTSPSYNYIEKNKNEVDCNIPNITLGTHEKYDDSLKDSYENAPEIIPDNRSEIRDTECEVDFNISNVIGDNQIHDSGICESDLSYDVQVESHLDSPFVNLDSCENENSNIELPVTQTNDDKSITNRPSLKRSWSDSELFCNVYNSHPENNEQRKSSILKRFKRNDETEFISEHAKDPRGINGNVCDIIQNSRRNSVSGIYSSDVSFCILIDNDCIITEENSYNEIEENSNHYSSDSVITEESSENVISKGENEVVGFQYSDTLVLESTGDRDFEETWVDDVACVETVVSDDIMDDFIVSGPASPNNPEEVEYDSKSELSPGLNTDYDHMDKVKHLYGDNIHSNDVRLMETLYKTPQMNVNKTLVSNEEHTTKLYDSDYLEKILSDTSTYNDRVSVSNTESSNKLAKFSENIEDIVMKNYMNHNNLDNEDTYESEMESIKFEAQNISTQVMSCESSTDEVFADDQSNDGLNSFVSSSTEVSSTTSEERVPGIYLKITNYKGSIVSEINNKTPEMKRVKCKFTETLDYISTDDNTTIKKPLITKAAQKYIPPLNETIRDLKIKLPLPQNKLLKLKQLKVSKEIPKLNEKVVIRQDIVNKKPKPRFEDVLKSIDEIQIKMSKEKSKKVKRSIPKVVIKKNQNGSHYASTKDLKERDNYNPDLTGSKWQPWVFLEKNRFIDSMASKNKSRAIYNHRKKSYVLAEKFKKYKSISSTKFIISQPKQDSTSAGQLKYTIRLKHN